MARRRVEQAVERHARQLANHDALAETYRAFSTLTGRIERYIAANPVRLEVAEEVPQPKLQKGETAADAIERVRSRIGGLARDAKVTARAPTTVDEAKVKMRAIVDELANSGRPDVAPLFGRGATIRWPMTVVPQHVVDGYATRSIDGAALLCFAMKTALVAALDAEIEAHGAEIDGGMLTADRERRLVEIEDEVLSLGYDEAALIDAAAEAGHVVVPRARADPRWVLGLAPDAPRPREQV
jgi:hypothetical protein